MKSKIIDYLLTPVYHLLDGSIYPEDKTKNIGLSNTKIFYKGKENKYLRKERIKEDPMKSHWIDIVLTSAFVMSICFGLFVIFQTFSKLIK